MANRVGKLSDGREVYENCLLLNEQIEDFKSTGIAHPYLAALDDVASIRIEGLSDNGSRTSMMPIRARKRPTILTRDSVFMTSLMAEVIMRCHKGGKYPDIFTDAEYDILFEKAKTQSNMAPEDRNVHVLEGQADSEGKFMLTPEMDDTKFILRAHASRYFEVKKHTQIPFYDLPDTAPKGKAIANYVWFSEPRSGSWLDARYRGLSYGDGRAFGVLDKTSEAGSQNSGYNLTRIENASQEAIERTAREMEVAGVLKLGFVEKASETLLNILRKGK